MSVFELFISAIFVNNIVLAQYLGNCPYLGCSRDKGVAVGMGSAVIFVIFMATLCTWLMQRYVLVPFELGYLQTIVFILVIAGLVQFVEMFLKKAIPPLYSALGIFLPLITTNCAVLGAAKTNISNSYSFIGSLVYGVAAGVGYTLAIVLFAALRGGVEPRLHARAHPHGGHPRTAGHLPCAQGTHGNPHRADHGGADVAGLHGLQGYDLIEKENRYGYDIGTGAPRARAGDGDGARRGVPRLPC